MLHQKIRQPLQKFWYFSSFISNKLPRHDLISKIITSPVSKTMISLSLKELSIFWKQSNKLLATAKTFLKCRIVFVVFANIYLSTNMMKFFILLSNQTTSGPAISNRHRPASLSCESNLTALPTPLFCSWGWLIAIEKKRFALLLTAKFPLQNSSYISEHV